MFNGKKIALLEAQVAQLEQRVIAQSRYSERLFNRMVDESEKVEMLADRLGLEFFESPEKPAETKLRKKKG